MGFTLLVPTATAQTTDSLTRTENEKLEQWLSDNKLNSLLLEHLESQLQSTQDAQQRQLVAQKLATLYANQLLKKEGQTRQWLDRTKALVALYPAFESGQLRVATLHARFMETETRFREWYHRGADEKGKAQLSQDLAILSSDLDAVSSTLEKRSAELFTIRQMRSSGTGTPESQIVDAELLHCHFLAGWTGYFRAIVDQDFSPARIDLANFRFREFLQLDQRAAITEYDSRWFDFSSPWQIRAMVGLANIETIRNKHDRATHVWNLLTANGVSRDRPTFELNSLCYAGQFDRAARLAEKVLNPTTAGRPGNILFAITASNAAPVAGRTDQSSASRLADLSLAGLSRERAGQSLQEQVLRLGTFAPRRNASATEHMAWGYLLFWRAGQSDQDDLLEQAREYLGRAIRKFDATDPLDENAVLDRERSRFLLAWVDLEEQKINDAAGKFSRVAESVAGLDSELAAESLWQSTSLSIRTSSQSTAGRSAMLLDRFLQRFPESKFAQTARLERMKLELGSLPPQTALDRLAAIPQDHPARANVLLEIVRQELRKWKSESSTGVTLERVRSACQQVERFERSSSRQKSLACQVLLDGLLLSDDASAADITRTLARASSWAGENVPVDLLYREFLVSQKLGQTERTKETAAALLNSSSESRFDLPVLISLAQLKDKELKANPDSEPQIQSAMQTYLQLSNRLGTDDETLMSNSNARVAFSRLGELQVAAGFLIEAKSTFRKLARLFPAQTRYLRGQALAETASGNHQAAKTLWSKISAGVQPGSDLWFEAKLKTIEILAIDDKPSAIKLLNQTRLLGGELPPRWSRKLDDAQQELTP